MAQCSYPHCRKKATIFHRPRTWLERVADVDVGPSLCKEHEFFRMVDPEQWRKANVADRAVMEIQASEDFEALDVLSKFRAIQEESWRNR